MIWAGFPAQPHVEWLREQAQVRKLGDLMKKVRRLEKTVKELEKK